MWKQLKSLQENVVIEIKDGCCERFLNLCRFNGISMWNIKISEEGITAKISRQDFLKIKQYVHKSKVHVRVVKKNGIRFVMFRYRKHYSFLVGILLSLIIIKVLSLYIWNISYTGNTEYTNQLLNSFLTENNYKTGMLADKVNCDEIESKIRNKFENITWVSAEISGTKLIVHIKENDGIVAVDKVSNGPSDINSLYDGTVISIVTRKGTPQVKVGDQVTNGQKLVSGVVEIKNDAAEVVSQDYVCADADITIRTNLDYYDKLDKEQMVKIYTGRTKSSNVIGFQNKYIVLGISFEHYDEYDVVTETDNLKMAENFCIPLCLGVRKEYEYKYESVVYSDSEAERILNNKLIAYLNKLEENQVQIRSNRVNMKTETNSCIMEGIIEADVTKTDSVPLEEQSGSPDISDTLTK